MIHAANAMSARRSTGLSPAAAALAAAFVAMATIAGAWAFELYGFAPCELCLQQRWAYYAGIPLAFAAAMASATRPRVGGLLLAALALVFSGSAIFGAWHAGVEWGFWPGPAGCTGSAVPKISDMGDFLRQMETTRLVRCDEVAIRILGLSLAGWNAVVSLGIAALAALGARKASAS